MAQILRPESDIALGSWLDGAGLSPTELYSQLGASSPEDDTFVYTVTADDVFEVALGAGTDPGIDTGHKVRFRVLGDGATPLTVQLLDNSVSPALEIWRTVEQSPVPGTSAQTYEYTLQESDAGLIQDYTALSLRFTSGVVSAGGGGGGGTIEFVQGGGTSTANSQTASRAFDTDLTSGNLITVLVAIYKDANDPLVIGDISQTAGTATLGAFSPDAQRFYEYSAGNYLEVAVFSAIVTGSGSCTVTVGGAPVGSYWLVAAAEYSSTTGWDSNRVEDSASNEGATGAPDIGSMTSVSTGLFTGVTAYSTNNTTITPDGAYSTIFESEDATHQNGSAIEQIVSGGTTDSVAWTAPTTSAWAGCSVVYQTA